MTCAVLLGSSVLGACTSGGGEPAGSDVVAGDAAAPLDVGGSVGSGVGVVADGCGVAEHLASGVVVDEPGQVVTVAHVVAGASTVTVVDVDGLRHPATIVAFDSDRDLAVLSVDGLDAPSLPLSDAGLGAATTLRWTATGGVEAKPVEVTTRLAITIDDIYGQHSIRRSGIELNGVIDVGDSGGPVLAAGEQGTAGIIGIVYARSQQRGSTAFATDSTEVRDVLDALSDGPVDNGACL